MSSRASLVYGSAASRSTPSSSNGDSKETDEAMEVTSLYGSVYVSSISSKLKLTSKSLSSDSRPLVAVHLEEFYFILTDM